MAVVNAEPYTAIGSRVSEEANRAISGRGKSIVTAVERQMPELLSCPIHVLNTVLHLHEMWQVPTLSNSFLLA